MKQQESSVRQETDVLSAVKIIPFLTTEQFGRNVFCLETVDSTNNEAKRRNACPHGSVFIAQTQESGKGRLGRSWSSEKGAGVLMSVLLHPNLLPCELPCVTLVAGLAVCRALRNVAGVDARIKWPNDVVVNGKKVCGILTEMSARMEGVDYVVAGIGINVNQGEFPPDLASKATSLKMETGAAFSRAEIVCAVLQAFEKEFAAYLQTRQISNEYLALCVNIGRRVEAQTPTGTVAGTAVGVSPAGELLVETDSGIVSLNSGEVSVQGIYGQL